MSALFRTRGQSPALENWAKLAERRSSPVVIRLRAGLFLRYHSAIGAKESDAFLRDAKTWALFEHAVLPELENFSFFDKSREIYVSPSAVLADGMFHLWTVTDLGLDDNGQTTTIAVITEMAHYLCAIYETTRIDRREVKRNWFGLSPPASANWLTPRRHRSEPRCALKRQHPTGIFGRQRTHII